MTHRAVALFSGGLDSTLAVLAVLRQGIEVKAITFTHFASDSSENLFSAAEMFKFEVKSCDISDKFIETVKNPKFGHGKNMNPCLDCRILMLKETKKFMEMIGADFILTGEVLGQRPMSQRIDTFHTIDREAGLKDYVLRPLSAKLLTITVPEENGIVNREMLYNFNGRSRKPQISLAREFGLKDYPPPAGGCLLTEPNYSYRLKELLTYSPNPDLRDLSLLKMGRHFRFSPLCKIIVGRDMHENEKIKSLSSHDLLLKVEGYGSPTALVIGEVTEEALMTAASICARYSDAKNLSEVEVSISKGNATFKLRVPPAGNDLLRDLRILKRDEVVIRKP